jgi:predicted esterase
MNRKLFLGLFVVVVLFVGLAARPAQAEYSEEDVFGHSQGNHRLDCTVIRPWDSSVGPGNTEYPVIVWANGWGGNDVAGDYTTGYYIDMLREWTLDGPYIVIAANQWSVQESDVLACLEWILDQNSTSDSEYEGVVNTAKIGLAGHSQGGGAVVKAGDGEPNGFDITTVVTMNPYGPSWVDAANQDGPVMIITGSEDEVTPYSWTYPVFEAVQTNDQGGLYAVLQGAGHSNIGRYQTVVKLWWQFQLNGKVGDGKALAKILKDDPWDTQYTSGGD